MCTINQKPVKAKQVVGYKICKLYDAFPPFQPETYYKQFVFKKGINKASPTSIYNCDDDDQFGFHCFKYLKDANNFLKGILEYRDVIESSGISEVVIIRVILSKNIRLGDNDITIPVLDQSPCYVAEHAEWNGKLIKRAINSFNSFGFSLDSSSLIKQKKTKKTKKTKRIKKTT